MKFLLTPLFLLCFTTVTQAEKFTNPIEAVKTKPNKTAFADSKVKKPIEIKDAKTAEKYFDADELKTLKEKVDFKEQIVLVFAWRGSGQDKLDYAVAESFPEQIFFSYKPGRTRDLRPHVAVFALRSNVKWRVK